MKRDELDQAARDILGTLGARQGPRTLREPPVTPGQLAELVENLARDACAQAQARSKEERRDTAYHRLVAAFNALYAAGGVEPG